MTFEMKIGSHLDIAASPHRTPGLSDPVLIEKVAILLITGYFALILIFQNII